MAILSPLEIYVRALAAHHATATTSIDHLLSEVTPYIPPNGVFGYTNSQVIEKVRELFHSDQEAHQLEVSSRSVYDTEIVVREWPWDIWNVVLPTYIQPEGWITFFGRPDSDPEGWVTLFGNINDSALGPSVFPHTVELPAFRYGTQYRILSRTQSLLERCFYRYFSQSESGFLNAMSRYLSEGRHARCQGLELPRILRAFGMCTNIER